MAVRQRGNQTLVPVPYLGIVISEGIGVCKVVGAILEIVPSPIIGEAIAFPVGSFNDKGFSVKAPADGNMKAPGATLPLACSCHMSPHVSQRVVRLLMSLDCRLKFLKRIYRL